MVIMTIIDDHHDNDDDNAYQETCQHYHYEDKTGWGPARDRCKENNADLVVVNNDKENM